MRFSATVRERQFQNGIDVSGPLEQSKAVTSAEHSCQDEQKYREGKVIFRYFDDKVIVLLLSNLVANIGIMFWNPFSILIILFFFF